MTDNPYDLLGVKPTASDKEIKSAYRKLAKELHPDLKPGDTEAEERFKAISSAYAILGNKEQRARFDRGEIDATGKEQPDPQYYRSYAGEGPETHYYTSDAFGDFGDESDLFSELFRRARSGAGTDGRGPQMPIRGQDAHYQLKVDFLDATLGAKKRITMPDGSTLDISVPAGIRDGQSIRLKGKGAPGYNKGPNGDAYVKIEVAPHRLYRQEGRDILIELPISLDEAVLGAKISVPTIHGKVNMTIPAGASSGQTLRLKGKGIAAANGGTTGDQLIRLKIILPKRIDPELQSFMEKWRSDNAYSVRQNIEGAGYDK
ncbi:MAG: molecular chaperone DnaJ [Sneathiella sp.]|uniref:DnaJ C-terminal domain-containing protein n=1 Tax=Sneathiella sp. TaxID=1964365 RepID=UPI000C685F09|nr:DnaJ C-terminal domain-containing protein [Sneathiella sp.]MAZ03682.1 molecular chaperone DnaJ [Sneathiella sp.]